MKLNDKKLYLKIIGKDVLALLSEEIQNFKVLINIRILNYTI